MLFQKWNRGFKGLVSKRVKDIVEENINDLKAAILQDKDVTKALSSTIDPEVINKVLIPKYFSQHDRAS